MKYLSLLLIVLLPFIATAQSVSGGVRIGLNMSSFSGPSEVDDSGNELETFDNNTGFLVGGLINVALTDLFGLRAELHFSQKGGRKIYEGQTSTLFNPESENEVLVIGDRKTVLRISTSYIDIPIMAYVQPVKKLQIFAGFNVGFLIGATGFGQLDINGISAVGQVPVNFTTTLDHNYFQDEGYATTDIGESIDFDADGSTVQIPTKTGAYVLDFPTKQQNTFNKIDVGVLGGLSYKLNGSLFIAVMYDFGLLDATNDSNDIARAKTNDNERIFREDIDRNRSLQLSLGFQF